MKAAILHGPRDFRVENVSDPKLQPDGIIIRVKACGICGSELHCYEWGLPSEAEQIPRIQAVSISMFGHEWSGEVVEVGANVTHIKPGGRVIGFGYGAFAEYVSIIARSVMPLPDDMSYEVGATVEPTGIGMNIVMKAEPVAEDTVVVFGAGTIGQCTWQIFKAMGVSKVIVTEVAKKRLEVAKALGADMVINAAEEDVVEKVHEATSGMGADIVAICCTSPVAFQQAFDVVRGGGLYQMQIMGNPTATDPFSDGGKIVMVAGPGQFEWRFSDVVIQKSLRLIGCWGGRMKGVLDLLRAGKVNTKSLITHEFPLDKINEAFETQLKREEAVKVLVKP